MNIIFASHNLDKLAELQLALQPTAISLIPQSAYGISTIEETAVTFIENALLKARHAAKLTGLPVIAEDSGLEVFYLKGQPGIYSARYAGEKATAQDNIAKLLKKLKNIPDEKRAARFYCCLVYLSHMDDASPLICEGSWNGVILKKPQGEKGFGYDPIFYVPTEKCSAAVLSPDQKNKLSHRGKAIQSFIKKYIKNTSPFVNFS